jgi:hypothetical protein
MDRWAARQDGQMDRWAARQDGQMDRWAAWQYGQTRWESDMNQTGKNEEEMDNGWRRSRTFFFLFPLLFLIF